MLAKEEPYPTTKDYSLFQTVYNFIVSKYRKPKERLRIIKASNFFSNYQSI